MKPMEAPNRLKLRIAMDRAAAAGHWQRHAELQQQWMEAMLGRPTSDSFEQCPLGPPARTDSPENPMDQDNQPRKTAAPAPEQAEEGDGGIDWANVASEAAAMVELNRSATTSWKGRQGETEDE